MRTWTLTILVVEPIASIGPRSRASSSRSRPGNARPFWQSTKSTPWRKKICWRSLRPIPRRRISTTSSPFPPKTGDGVEDLLAGKCVESPFLFPEDFHYRPAGRQVMEISSEISGAWTGKSTVPPWRITKVLRAGAGSSTSMRPFCERPVIRALSSENTGYAEENFFHGPYRLRKFMGTKGVPDHLGEGQRKTGGTAISWSATSVTAIISSSIPAPSGEKLSPGDGYECAAMLAAFSGHRLAGGLSSTTKPKRTEKEVHVSASAGAGAPGDGLQ